MNVPGVADPDPPDEVDDPERPADGDVVAPQADARSRPWRRWPTNEHASVPTATAKRRPHQPRRARRPDRRRASCSRELGVGRATEEDAASSHRVMPSSGLGLLIRAR